VFVNEISIKKNSKENFKVSGAFFELKLPQEYVKFATTSYFLH
jgi:hypothetical protein